MKKPMISKKEFIHNTSRYLKLAQEQGGLVITHRNSPALELVPVKKKSIKDLKGLLTEVKVEGDINDPAFEDFDKW